jgi:hypothetical protein
VCFCHSHAYLLGLAAHIGVKGHAALLTMCAGVQHPHQLSRTCKHRSIQLHITYLPSMLGRNALLTGFSEELYVCGVPSSAALVRNGEAGVRGYSCDSALPKLSPSAAGALLPAAAASALISSGGGLATGVLDVAVVGLELHIPIVADLP